MNLIKEIKEFIKNNKKPLIVLLGPTASGKTGLSLKIAKEINGEIISTDSRQIYREMEVGTDSILPEDQCGVPHHMLGITAPDSPLTLADYKEMALNVIEGIYKRGNLPILVGGTGLYVSAIIEGYDVPRIPPNKKLREELEKMAKEKGNEYLHKRLAKVDPETAENIHPNNLRYVIRAIEINETKGENKKDSKRVNGFHPFLIGIVWPRKELYDRVNLRVDLQLKRGLVDEVRKLVARGYDENLPAMSSLGVKEIIPYVKGEMSLEECVEILKRNTRRYAKRQMTWLKRYDNVQWLTPEDLEKIIKE